MKKSLTVFLPIIIIVMFIISSCQPQLQLTDRDEETYTFAIDFREYTEKGFLFMPDEYYGEYEVKGIITMELHPNVRYIKGKLQHNMEGHTLSVIMSGETAYTKVVKNVKIEDLIEQIYQLAIEWGGDAFTHFKSSIESSQTNANHITSYPYYSISGIVIKRK